MFVNYFSTCVKDKLINHFGNKISNNCTTSANINTTISFEPITADEVIDR